MYVCVQVFPENRCIVKGVVGRNHVLVDLYYPVGGCACRLWSKVPAVAAPAEKTERRGTHMTKQEAAIVELYTGICMLVGEDRKYVYAYARKLMGRPILTQELSDERLKEKSKADFIKLCKNLKNMEDSAYWESCDLKRLEHGFIESIPNGGVCCSKCRRGFPKEYRRWKYCPDCGARMKQISLDTKRSN